MASDPRAKGYSEKRRKEGLEEDDENRKMNAKREAEWLQKHHQMTREEQKANLEELSRAPRVLYWVCRGKSETDAKKKVEQEEQQWQKKAEEAKRPKSVDVEDP